MKAGKSLVWAFGMATGAAVTMMAMGKPGKKTRGYITKKHPSPVKANTLQEENDMIYI